MVKYEREPKEVFRLHFETLRHKHRPYVLSDDRV